MQINRVVPTASMGAPVRFEGRGRKLTSGLLLSLGILATAHGYTHSDRVSFLEVGLGALGVGMGAGMRDKDKADAKKK